MKRPSNLSQLMGYAGGHRYLTWLSLLLSAVSAVLALFPFVFLFFIIREVLKVAPDYAQATHVVQNGWLAVLFAVLSILVYICGLMCSHLSAFRIAGNIRKALIQVVFNMSLTADPRVDLLLGSGRKLRSDNKVIPLCHIPQRFSHKPLAGSSLIDDGGIIKIDPQLQAR